MSLYEIKISGLNSLRLIIKICRKKQTKESLLLKGTYNRTKNHLKCIKVLQIKIFFDGIYAVFISKILILLCNLSLSGFSRVRPLYLRVV